MSAAEGGPVLKKRRLLEVAPDDLRAWLGAQVEGLCTDEQKMAIQELFGDYETSELQGTQVDFLDHALREIIPDKNKRLRIVSALHNAKSPAPPTPAPRH